MEPSKTTVAEIAALRWLHNLQCRRISRTEARKGMLADGIDPMLVQSLLCGNVNDWSAAMDLLQEHPPINQK